MNKSLTVFKVESLIQMARLTDDLAQKERYISLAEEELNNICQNNISEVDDSIDLFLKTRKTNDFTKRTLRSDVYTHYFSYCQSKNYQAVSKNVFYRMLRERGITEIKSNGDFYFKISLC